MNNELNKHKKSDSIKWIVVFTAIILLAVSLVAIATQGFSNSDPYGWFENKNEQKPEESTDAPKSEENNDIGEAEPIEPIYSMENSNGIKVYNTSALKLLATPMMAAEDPVTGYSMLESVTVEAFVYPEGAKKDLIWSVHFESPDSAWASGKNPEDYITVSNLTEDGTKISISLKQEFQSRIIVMATSKYNSNCTAYCLVDYAAKLEDTLSNETSNDLFFIDDVMGNGTNYVKGIALDDAEQMKEDYSYSFLRFFPSFKEGTVESDVASYAYEVQLSDDFFNALENAGLVTGSENNKRAITGQGMEISAADIINALVDTPLITDDYDYYSVDNINAFNGVASQLSGNAFTITVTVTSTTGEVKAYTFNFAFESENVIQYPIEIDLSDFNIVF